MKVALTLLSMILVSLSGELSAEEMNIEKYIFDLRKAIESKDHNFAEYKRLNDLHRKSKLPSDQKVRYVILDNERISTHKRVIKLRDYLQKGRSVFDYPGLLALGKTSHNGSVYKLTISAGVKYGRPASLLVRFDGSGSIIGAYTAVVTK